MKLKQIRVSGYKNLIDCSVDLGDFNVLVGPNNSGKSNLLEVPQMLNACCFGSQDTRELIFSGRTTRSAMDNSICHLVKHKDEPLKIGINFEANVNERTWKVDYEVSICRVRYEEDKEKTGFLRELLEAKEISKPAKPGRATIYLERSEKGDKQILRVKKKGKQRSSRHIISKKNPSLQAIESLYPEYEGLPDELRSFIRIIQWIGYSQTFALSPVSLRRDYDTEKVMEGFLVSTFDISLALDKLKEEGKYYELFKEAMCDILDLEDVDFKAEDYNPSPEDEKSKPKRIRFFRLKRKGSYPSWIEEFSDGTQVVAGILVSMFSETDRGPILYLEELENCLHPEAVDKLLRFLQDNSDRWPVLITTHSPYLLNGVNPTDVNVAVVDETGASHFEKVKNTRELREYLNKSLMSFGDLLVNNYDRFRE